MAWFLKLLERWGRKYVMVNEKGQIIMEKYVLLGRREGRWAKWPTLNLHHFIYLGPDAFPHTHAGDFWSFVLKGGYVERLSDGLFRIRRRFSLAYLSHKDQHDIRQCLPNTWTLFYLGFHRHRWQLHRDGEAAKNYKTQCRKLTPEFKARIEKLQRRAARLHNVGITLTRESEPFEQ